MSKGTGCGGLLYFGGVLLSLLAAAQTLLRRWATLPKEIARLVALSSFATVLFGLVATFRLASGIDPVSVLRDFVPYFLLAIVPVLAVDAAARLSLTRLQVVATIGLSLGSIGWLVLWAARRGIAPGLGTEANVFGGFFLPIGLLILAAVYLGAARPSHRPIWGFFAGLAAASAIVSGTRSFVLAIPAVLIAVVFATRPGRSRVSRVVAAVAITLAAGGLVTLALSAMGFESRLVLYRWSLLESALTNPTGDASVVLRIAQTQTSWHLFLSSPVFGVPTGIGAFAASRSDYISDSPLALLAGFGLVGAGAVLAIFVGWIGIVVRRTMTIMWPRAVMLGVMFAALTFSLILPIVQDKGVGFVFLLLGAPVLRTLLDSAAAGHEHDAAPHEMNVRAIRRLPLGIAPGRAIST